MEQEAVNSGHPRRTVFNAPPVLVQSQVVRVPTLPPPVSVLFSPLPAPVPPVTPLIPSAPLLPHTETTAMVSLDPYGSMTREFKKLLEDQTNLSFGGLTKQYPL